MRRLTALLSFTLAFGTLACGAASQTQANGTGGDVGTGGVDTTEGSTGGAGGTGATSNSGGQATASGGTGGVADEYPPLTACSGPSVDRLQKWFGTGEGPTVPGDGSSLLVPDGDGYLAKVAFASAPNWHVAPVWVANEFKGVDLSASTELRIEYSATSDLFVQLRPESTYSGGNKWHASLPSTSGEFVTKVIPLTAENWVEKLGTPPVSLAETLTEVLGVVFVGNTNNVIEIRSLRFKGYTPPCL